MDDYKFTKGKWNIFIDNIIKSEIFIMVGKIPIVRIALNNYENEKEAKANALLISKSPEMLKMLEELLYDLEDVSIPTSMYDTVKRAKQLIKEATEL